VKPVAEPEKKKRKYTPRVTNAEIDRRVSVVTKLLVQAYRSSEIIEHCAREWGVGKGGAQLYINKARELIREDCGIDRHDFIGSRLAMLDQIARASIETGQHSNAVGALRLQLEIIGGLAKK
jgi:hypothetical protein